MLNRPSGLIDPLGLVDLDYHTGIQENLRFRDINPGNEITVADHAGPANVTRGHLVADISQLPKYRKNPNMPIRYYICLANKPDPRLDNLPLEQWLANTLNREMIVPMGFVIFSIPAVPIYCSSEDVNGQPPPPHDRPWIHYPGGRPPTLEWDSLPPEPTW